jgi:hypothetical protein
MVSLMALAQWRVAALPDGKPLGVFFAGSAKRPISVLKLAAHWYAMMVLSIFSSSAPVKSHL